MQKTGTTAVVALEYRALLERLTLFAEGTGVILAAAALLSMQVGQLEETAGCLAVEAVHTHRPVMPLEEVADMAAVVAGQEERPEQAERAALL